MYRINKKRVRMYRFLVWGCHFQKETLDMLNFKSLTQLAADYGFRK